MSENEWVDQDGFVVLNETDVASSQISAALSNSPEVAAMVRWGQQLQRRQGGIFERDKYVCPDSPFDQMRVAYDAARDDDVVAGVIEMSEALSFGRLDFDADNEDEENILQQIAEDTQLADHMRSMWRELFTVSQAYVAVWWGKKDYKVKGKSEGGKKRKKVYTGLNVPIGISLLDPLKIVPVGNFMFGKEQLAYIASDDLEVDTINDVLAGNNTSDLVVDRIIRGPYRPSEREKGILENLDIDPERLFLLDPETVWRVTDTRSSYERFANIRMKSVFELLDLKRQLREMDRAHLIGGPLRVDQRIATPNGWKLIGEAKVGDQVFSVDGKPTEIVGVYPQGVLPGMHRVTFTDGAEVVCDLKHPWTVFDRFGRERTIPLSLIIEEGLFDSNGKARVHRHRIPIAQPLDLPEVDLPLDPYLIGYMLGDGSLSQSIPKITCAEPEDDQPWRSVLPEGVTVSQYESRVGFCNQYGLKGSRWHFNEVTQGLRELGLWGVSGENKFIPERYLWASVQQRWALLQGLCDSDGHSHQAGGVEFSNISRQLVDGIVQLVQSLGGVAKVSERRVRFNEQPCYRVWISLHQKDAPFRIHRKAERWESRKVPYVRAFAKVEPVEDAQAVCIKTAREDGLFLTEGMVVTHNTNFIILVKKGTDDLPAKPQEVRALAQQVQASARMPLIVGDHRLSIEIITPKNDQTLQPDRYNGLDARITARLFGMFMTGNFAAGAKGDDSIKLARVIARGFETRRSKLVETINRELVKQIMERNVDKFDSEDASLEFHPQRIALDFDPAMAMMIQDLRDRGDLSREYTLDQLGADQETEAKRRSREKDKGYDDIFKPVQVPFDSPDKLSNNTTGDPSTEGRRQGGNKNGGGTNPDSTAPNDSPARPRKPAGGN